MHKIWASENPLFCILCGMMFHNHKLLIKHLSNDHKVQCDHCPIRFHNRKQITAHIALHRADNIFQLKHILHKNTSEGIKNTNTSGTSSETEQEKLLNLQRHCKNKITQIANNSHLTKKNIKLQSKKSKRVRKKILQSEYSCPLCNYVCKEKQEITAHRRKQHLVHSVQKDKNIYCGQSSLQLLKDKQFPCEFCKCSFKTSSYLQRHIIVKHGDEKLSSECVVLVDDMDIEVIKRAKRDIDGTTMFHCDECGKDLLNKDKFVRHIRIHRGEKPFCCHICQKNYRTVLDLSRHLKFVHEKVKKHQCDICGQYFGDNFTRNDHLRTHTGERPYLCQTCGKSYPSRSALYLHCRTHSDYFPYYCSYCNKKYKTERYLEGHIRTHTGEKPFPCETCGKCFRLKNKLTLHKLTHSNEKPHMCPECGAQFRQKRYLRNHMKIHGRTAVSSTDPTLNI